MHRHDKVREILKEADSGINKLERKEFDDEKKRIRLCEQVSDKLQKAYLMVTDLKRESEENT